MESISFNQLNKIIAFERPIKIPDGLGGYEINWQEVTRTWAKIIQINNLNPQVRSHNFNKNFYKFIIRFRNNLSLNMRIYYRKGYFKIETVNNIGNNDKYLEIITYERIKNDAPN